LNSAVHQNLLAGKKLIKEPVNPKENATHLKTLKSRKYAWRKCTINENRMVKHVVRKTPIECLLRVKSTATCKILAKKRLKNVSVSQRKCSNKLLNTAAHRNLLVGMKHTTDFLKPKSSAVVTITKRRNTDA
jgi:hypothetical protein